MVADFRDPPRHVGLAGLVAFRRQPEMGADLPRGAEAPRIVDRRREGQRHQRTHPGHAAQLPHALIGTTDGHQAPLQRLELRQQRLPRRQQRVGHRLQRGMARHQLAHPRRKGLRRRRPHLQPEAAQHPAQAHLHVKPLALQQLARRQQRPRLLRRNRLAVHRPEPAQPHQLRDPARVLAVRLHRHRLERRPHMPRLQQHGRQPGRVQRREQPLRPRPGFKADPGHHFRPRPEPGDQRLSSTLYVMRRSRARRPCV